MNLTEVVNLLRRNAKQNSPVILSTVAGVGTLMTAYLAAKASFQAARVLDDWEEKNGISDDRKERVIDRTKVVWKLYIPTAVSATSTIVCIIAANRVEASKTIAAQTAFTVSQQLYSEYRDKVVEEFGARKDESIRDSIAQERVLTNPPPSNDILVSGPGNVLCCEQFTGRYFTSDMETLRKAQNDLNSKLLSQDYATLYDFYYMIGLGATSYSEQLGWKSDKLMELQFSTVLTDDGRPCLSFDYNYTATL
jgi:hypothetical protein